MQLKIRGRLMSEVCEQAKVAERKPGVLWIVSVRQKKNPIEEKDHNVFHSLPWKGLDISQINGSHEAKAILSSKH